MKNLVFITSHDLGRHLGCYGHPTVRTPNIDALATGGTRFSNSFCTAPQCSPSRAALWTGRYPHETGVIGLTHGDFANEMKPGIAHLAEILGQSGFETHLFGAAHEVRELSRAGHHCCHEDGEAHDIGRHFADWLASRDSTPSPFFAEINFFEPHRPFPHHGIAAAPPEDVTVPAYLPDLPVIREDCAEMEASIAAMDAGVGKVIAAIADAGIADDTLIVFTADHGIPFPLAKMSLYDAGIEVPLIFHGSGIPEGKTCDALVSNVDVMPTILELFGIDQPDSCGGQPLTPVFSGGPFQERTEVFAEKTYHTYYDPMRAIRTRDWKLIANFEFTPSIEVSPDFNNNARGYPETSLALDLPPEVQYRPPFELYDLRADPLEQNNLATNPEYTEQRDLLARGLRQWMEATEDPLLEGPVPQGAYRERMATFRNL